MQFGLFDWIDRAPVDTSQLYEQRLKLVELADKAGFYGYHLAEHHGTTLNMAPSPAVFFSALAQRTKNIRFSAMAFLLPMYHPIRLIEEVCMLDHLSNGRVEVGISRGVSPYEMKCFGVNPESSKEIFNEVLEIFQRGMTGSSLDYAGKYFQFENVPIPLSPLQTPHPPLWYPTFSESGTNYAAKNGFNFLTLGPSALAARLASLYRKTANQSESESVKQFEATKIGAMRQVFLADTDDQALKIAEPAYRDWFQSITELWHRNNDSSFDDFFAWESCLANETILIGSTGTVREKIQQLVEESGINYFVGSFAWGSLSFDQSRESLSRFASEVIPTI